LTAQILKITICGLAYIASRFWRTAISTTSGLFLLRSSLVCTPRSLP